MRLDPSAISRRCLVFGRRGSCVWPFLLASVRAVIVSMIKSGGVSTIRATRIHAVLKMRAFMSFSGRIGAQFEVADHAIQTRKCENPPKGGTPNQTRHREKP